MDNGIIAALIGGAVAVLGIGAAAAVAFHQITKQARMGLKVDLYREILAALDRQGDAERALSTKLRVLNSLIGVWLLPDEFPGAQPLVPNTSWAELNELIARCQTDAADLMILIEKWMIVDPRLDIFRMAFGVGLRDLRAAWAPLSHSVGRVVPPAPGLPSPARPPDQTLEHVKERCDDVLTAASKVSAWAADFQVEVQALLLSDLFKNPLIHREPLDPEYFVIRLDRYAEIKDYFENRTTWGLEHKSVNEQTKEAIARRHPWLQVNPVERVLP